ncbi:MAG TPA: sulfite exporter TauE/SafE family protein [Acidimicrobiia bacterium]|nr:sulfite exporter TauE/SafE family protein [Acidimicrobiia bacterium]
MSLLEALAVLGVGFFAGSINTIVGSGSLVTFPTLLAIGYSPVVANVSNTVGLVFGSVSGAYGYRRELVGQQRRLLVLGTGSLAGGLAGALLLLTLPSSVFDDVVPVLILVACALVVAQPRLSAMVTARRRKVVEHGGAVLWIAVLLTGVYGGYFGAAQGVILLALLGIFIAEDLQRLNGVKNVLAAIANGVAAIVFVFAANVAWEPALLLAVSSIAGAQLGASVGRRMPAPLLRTVIVVVGLIAAIKLLADF